MATPTNVLSSGIEITGSVRFAHDMIVDGKIEGEITSDKGRVTIGENAIIKGDISAGEVKVYGKIDNPLFPFSDRLPSVYTALGEKAIS